MKKIIIGLMAIGISLFGNEDISNYTKEDMETRILCFDKDMEKEQVTITYVFMKGLYQDKIPLAIYENKILEMKKKDRLERN